MRGIHDISPVTGLKPKAKFFADVGEECVNMDGVIAIMKITDTPQAKAIYRAFRRRHAEYRLSMPDKPAEKVREEAVLKAFEDCGHRITFTPLRGTM